MEGRLQTVSGDPFSGDFFRKQKGFREKHTENPPGSVFCSITGK